MKEQIQSVVERLAGASGILSADYTKLLGIVQNLIALRNEIETSGLDKDFVNGMCSIELLSISDKLDEILYNDFARPLSLCVLDSLALNTVAV